MLKKVLVKCLYCIYKDTPHSFSALYCKFMNKMGYDDKDEFKTVNAFLDSKGVA